MIHKSLLALLLVLSLAPDAVYAQAAPPAPGVSQFLLPSLPLTGGTLIGPLVQTQSEAHATSTKTASFVLDATMHNVAINASGAAVVATLPACISAIQGRVYTLKKLDSSTNAVSFAAAGSDLIDGAATLSFTTQYTAASVQCSDTVGRWDRGLN